MRSLALWRIITGIAVLYDLIFYKLLFLEKYYLSDILRPDSAIQPYYGNGFNIVSAFGEIGFTAFICFTIVLSVFFTVGLLDKFVKPVLFICYSLIIVNSFYLITGFHFMVLASLFWSIFLPTSGFWSFSKTKYSSLHIFALYGLYLQIALIYFTSFLVKNGDIWISGNAIELFIQDEYYASGWAFKLRSFPLVLKILNYTALVWEFLIPVFILWPFKKNLKEIAAIMILVLHIGLLFIAQVGPFLIIAMAFSAALLPHSFWERFGFSTNSRKIILLEPLKGTLTACFKTIIMLFVIVIMLKGNLRQWYSESHVSTLMRSIPGSSSLFEKRWIPSYFLYGFNDQPWVFFQMTTTTDLGLFVVVKEDENGLYSLNGKVIGHDLNKLNSIEVSDFENGFEHDLELTDYLYMVNLKGYSSRFNNATYRQILLNYISKNKDDKVIENINLVYLIKMPEWNGTAYNYEYSYYSFYELNKNEL